MLQVNQLKLPVEHTKADVKRKIEKELELKRIFKDTPNFSYKILKRSIDARKKPEIYYIYSVLVSFNNKLDLDGLYISDLNKNKNYDNEQTLRLENQILKKSHSKNILKYNINSYDYRDEVNTEALTGISKEDGFIPPVIIGEGPCGLFAGLIIAKAGLNPVIIERGAKVDKRVEKVNNFWVTGSNDSETNVQFGEGGAGTFSDGKLNTLVKDKTGKNQFVLDTFVRYGANSEVSFDSKPHVGTDVLMTVVKNIREQITSLGGTVINECKLTDLVVENSKITSIIVDNFSGETVSIKKYGNKQLSITPGVNEIQVSDVVLAIGHSARDTFVKLHDLGIDIEQKNFAIGIRIQHPQKMIDDSQYGKGHSIKLPPSPYKVTNHTSNGRDVFSFCMCPGGYVVNASSIEGQTCINGMSYSDRASENANSALIVAVDRSDFNSDDSLAGMELQNKMEKTAYEIGEGKIPVQLFKDYKEGKISSSFGSVNPMFKGETHFANLREIFPEEINLAIIESIEKFGYNIEGFDCKDAILAAVESRTSSPIRITRDEKFESNIKGIYPAGEGAGYAGGIMSAAMDGIKVADVIIDKYIERRKVK